MNHRQDAVELAVLVGRRAAHAKAAHVHPLRAGQNVLDHPPGQNHPRIGAGLARRVLDVLPGQAGPARHNVVVQKHERLRRVDAQPFQVRGRSIAVDVIHAHEPAVLGIGDGEAAAVALILGMRAGHVVGDGPQVAGFGQVQRPRFLGDHVAADQQAAVFHAVDVLGHLALAAAGGAFVHDDDLVLVGRNHGHGGAVVGGPALALANVEQHGIDALFGAGSRIEVVGEDLLVRALAVVNHHLPAGEVGVAEGRRHKQHSTRNLEVRRNLAAGNHALQVGQRGGKERCLAGYDQQGPIAQRVGSRIKRHGNQFLRLEPVQRLLAGLVEGLAEALLIGGLIGGQGIADHHRLRVAAAHGRDRGS